MYILFKKIGSVLAILVVSSLGLSNHASAMPALMHNMAGMGTASHHQSTANPTLCVTLCTSVVFSKDDLEQPICEDDEAALPFYAAFQGEFFDDLDTDGKLYASKVKPPSKVPIHILYGVFRS